MPVIRSSVRSLSKAGSTQLKGDVTLTGGTNVTLTQSGQDISIAASGGSGPFVRTATFVVAASDANDTTNADYFCDGTADEVQINQAISDLPATGGRIVLSEGLFTIAAAITVTKSNVILEGQGTSTRILLTNSTSANCIQVGNGSSPYAHITIRNFYIDGNEANQTIGGNGVKIFTNVTHAEISDCLITNTGLSNIYDDGAAHTRIINNYCDTTKSGNACSNVEGLGVNPMVLNNTLLSADFAGIDAYNSSGEVIVRGNYIHNPGVNAIYMEGSATAKISDNVIVITNDPTSFLIRTNNVAIVTDNKIFVTDTNTQALTAIRFQAPASIIANNEIIFESAAAHVGIAQNTGPSGCVINGNTLTLESPTSGSIGMDLSSTFADCLVTNNTLEGWDTGFYLDSAVDVSLNTNFIFNTSTGIDISAADNCALVGNQFDGVTACITSLSNSPTTYISINGNTFYNCTQDAVNMRSMQYCTVAGNTFNLIGVGTNDTYSGVLLNTVSGTNYAKYNTIANNTFASAAANKPKYNIRENSSNDGPNIVIGNICLNAQTAQISTQHASSQVANNIVS